MLFLPTPAAIIWIQLPQPARFPSLKQIQVFSLISLFFNNFSDEVFLSVKEICKISATVREYKLRLFLLVRRKTEQPYMCTHTYISFQARNSKNDLITYSQNDKM